MNETINKIDEFHLRLGFPDDSLRLFQKSKPLYLTDIILSISPGINRLAKYQEIVSLNLSEKVSTMLDASFDLTSTTVQLVFSNIMKHSIDLDKQILNFVRYNSCDLLYWNPNDEHFRQHAIETRTKVRLSNVDGIAFLDFLSNACSLNETTRNVFHLKTGLVI